MSATMGKDYWLQVERETIETSVISEPDPNWLFVDGQGHEHRYGPEFSTPTLKWVSFGRYWCADCHEYHEDGESQCATCGEHVVPGTRSPAGRTFVSGAVTIHGTLAPIHEDHPALLAAFNSSGPVDINIPGYVVRGAHATAVSAEGVDFLAFTLEKKLDEADGSTHGK